MPPPTLILASASPRRQQLLRELGYTFEVHPPDIDEDAFPDMPPTDLARHLALAKAEAVASRFPDAVVLGADTVVAFGDQVLGKPKDAEDARRMLALLSGTTQIVITGIAAMHATAPFSRSTRILSSVRMRVLTPRQIDDYIQTGHWRGKAGAYGIQDPDPFVIRIAGSHSNIVGLPLAATRQMLTAAGLPAPEQPAPDREA